MVTSRLAMPWLATEIGRMRRLMAIPATLGAPAPGTIVAAPSTIATLLLLAAIPTMAAPSGSTEATVPAPSRPAATRAGRARWEATIGIATAMPGIESWVKPRVKPAIGMAAAVSSSLRRHRSPVTQRLHVGFFGNPLHGAFARPSARSGKKGTKARRGPKPLPRPNWNPFQFLREGYAPIRFCLDSRISRGGRERRSRRHGREIRITAP